MIIVYIFHVICIVDAESGMIEVADVGMWAVGVSFGFEKLALCKVKVIVLECLNDKVDIGPYPIKGEIVIGVSGFDKE